MRFLVTNGGPHSAETWAEETTNSILNLIQVDPTSTTPEAAAARQAKRELHPRLFEVLNRHHAKVQAYERSELAARGPAQVDLDPTIHLPEVMAEFSSVIEGTPFADHFKGHAHRIEREIGQHFADSMHIERRYHADANPV